MMKITIAYMNGKSETYEDAIRKAGMDTGMLRIWTERGETHCINMMHVSRVTISGGGSDQDPMEED